MERDRIEEEEELISRGLYRLVSDVVGSEAEVKLRREKWKVIDVIGYGQPSNVTSLMSGSMAEGFEFETSDLDIMLFRNDIPVVENYSQFIDYHQYYKTVLMMNCEYTSPGFALVNCITRDDSHISIVTACVLERGKFWVSSKLYREYYLNLLPQSTGHGPCQSGEVYGMEYDCAHCLKCQFWPIQASSAISRMRRCGWPSEEVLQEVINDGCLIVPVASKKPMFEGASDLEWRISFSLAEKRLMHSMNHCQFLCYGLWKLFLSEVIKKLDGMEDILCSYFLKTIVFWEIFRDASAWTVSNFHSKFFRTLKLLIIFVNVGNCPNFFIPENNMFYGKVCGEKQRTLMSHLRVFHNEGFLCLLRCPSLQRNFLRIVQNPLLVHHIIIDEAQRMSQYTLRVMRLRCLCECDMAVFGEKFRLHELSKIERLNISSGFMSTVMTIRTRRLLQNIAEKTLHAMIQANTNNIRNRYLKFALNILRENNTYLGYSDLIIAKGYYLLGDYRKAIHTANIVKSKLQNQTTVYTWAISAESCYMLQTDDITIEHFLQQNVASQFELHEETTLLYPEIIAEGESTNAPLLHIPPLVLANFLLILSHHKRNDTVQMYDVLRELHVLVHHDNGFHIYNMIKAICWEILGICQQLCGEYPAAYNSYIHALNEEHNYFKSATIARLNSLPLFQ